MGEQLTLMHRDPDGYGDLFDDKLCEHCGKSHTLDGPYCCEACSHRARSDPDECKLVDYEPLIPGKDKDRSDCADYDVCLSYAIKANQSCVCTGCVTGYRRSTRQPFELLRSNMGMVTG